MAEPTKKKTLISHGIAAQNRKARYDYTIGETMEAGHGADGAGGEIPPRRSRHLVRGLGRRARRRDLPVRLHYIPEWQAGSTVAKFEPGRPRKLLLHKKQVVELIGAIARDGATIVPLQIHFNDKGIAKVVLGIAEGRKKHDKRDAIAERDWARDKARLMRNVGR